MSGNLFVSFKEENIMSSYEKHCYYKKLKDYCHGLSEFSNNKGLGQKLISKLYMNEFYKSKLSIEGEENILRDTPSIFLCNHSNAHDVFSMYKLLDKLGLSCSVMVADDCLSPIAKGIFASADSVFLDRRDKNSSLNSILEASTKIFSGKNLVVFGETTWNLHPEKVMHKIKRGSSMISTITNAPIIPVTLEYVEKDCLLKKESDLYSNIVLRFGKDISCSYLDTKLDELQLVMEKQRYDVWHDYGISKEEVDPDIYINHTWLKKFGVTGFNFDSLKESSYLLGNQTNEFTMKNGVLVPGVTEKKSYVKKV